jgi:hypothetical protein
MRRALIAAMLILTAAVLGATVMREPIAYAAERLPMFVVANTAANPVPVTSSDDPARQAFAFFDNDTMPADDPQHNVSFTVPAGKRLVIESVSGRAGFATATEELVSVTLQARVNDGLQSVSLPAVFQGRSPVATDPYLWAATDLVKIYADGGTDVLIFWTRNTSSAAEANLNISVQGYLIDCTAAPCA